MVTTRTVRQLLGGGLALLAVGLAATAAAADILLPPGFTARVYVTGEGFGSDDGPRGRGIPSTSTLAVDPTGALYLARTGRRYSGGEFDYLTSLYRIPAGGARLTPKTEARFLHGPPLVNAQVSAGANSTQTLTPDQPPATPSITVPVSKRASVGKAALPGRPGKKSDR